MPPLFSVVLPTYNRAAMAATALKTVLWQTDKDWECLVVDDGSTDGTRERLAPLAGGDPRVVLIRSEKNEGMNASRNKAIARAQGRFVTFLDSDDLWLPERLSAFRRRVERSPSAAFIFSNAWVLRYGRVIGTLFDPSRKIAEGVVPGHFAIGEAELPYVTTNLAIAKELFARCGTFRTEMKTLDTELFARVLAAGAPVAAIAEPLSVRRLHGEQLTDRYRENFAEAMLALKSSGAPPEVAERLRRRTAREVAGYLLKAGRPAEARRFLDDELGAEAKALRLYALTTVPAPILNAARALRRAWLTARHLKPFQSAAARRAAALISPLLSAEVP